MYGKGLTLFIREHSEIEYQKAIKEGTHKNCYAMFTFPNLTLTKIISVLKLGKIDVRRQNYKILKWHNSTYVKTSDIKKTHGRAKTHKLMRTDRVWKQGGVIVKTKKQFQNSKQEGRGRVGIH
jgi:hypothetical protein